MFDGYQGNELNWVADHLCNILYKERGKEGGEEQSGVGVHVLWC